MTFAVSVLALIDDSRRESVRRLSLGNSQKVQPQLAPTIARLHGAFGCRFVSKLCIVNEEIDEVVYWLEIAVRCKFLALSDLDPSATEARELRAIFGRSLKTIRQRLEPAAPMTR